MSVCTDAARSLHRFSVAESQIMLLHKNRAITCIKEMAPKVTIFSFYEIKFFNLGILPKP